MYGSTCNKECQPGFHRSFVSLPFQHRPLLLLKIVEEKHDEGQECIALIVYKIINN